LKENLTVNELMTSKADLEMEIIKHVARATRYFIATTGVPIKSIKILLPSEPQNLGMDAIVTLDLDVLDAVAMNTPARSNVAGDAPGQQYIFGSEL